MIIAPSDIVSYSPQWGTFDRQFTETLPKSSAILGSSVRWPASTTTMGLIVYPLSMKQVMYHERLFEKNVYFCHEFFLFYMERIVYLAILALLLGIITLLFGYYRIQRRKFKALEHLLLLRRRIFTNITTSFRTSLTMILGLSRDLHKSTDSMETKEKVQALDRYSAGLLSIINQLSPVSGGDADMINGDLTAHLAMIVDTYRDYADSHHIDLQFATKEAVKMDFVPDYINMISNNLLSNAFKFTPEYGRVNIVAWSEGGNFFIDFTNTGKGIDKKELPHVFEPFYQAKSDAESIGTGVGLTLVKVIIDALDGTVTAESEVDECTTFHIIIPIHNYVKHKGTGNSFGSTPLLPSIEPFSTVELRTQVDKLLEGRQLLHRKSKGMMPAEQNDDRPAFLAKVTDIIHHRILCNKEITISQIASAVFLSDRQFRRKIRALTGCSPTVFIQRVKIEKAKALLDGEVQMSFSEIAVNCGFNDYSSFVRTFKNTYGITPTGYRKGNAG